MRSPERNGRPRQNREALIGHEPRVMDLLGEWQALVGVAARQQAVNPRDHQRRRHRNDHAESTQERNGPTTVCQLDGGHGNNGDSG
jgi:hypothetical protein